MGYALNTGVSQRGLDAVAVAVRGLEGEPLAVIGLGAVAPRLEGERGELVARWLKEEVANLEQALNNLTNGLSATVIRRLAAR